jgi:hypothetical protein
LLGEVAELVPSETMTVLEPAGKAGTVNVTVELPLPFVVPPAVIDVATPPTVTVNACKAINPLAVIVADEPTVPLVGVNPVTDCVTVKLVPEVAEFVPSDTTTV